MDLALGLAVAPRQVKCRYDSRDVLAEAEHEAPQLPYIARLGLLKPVSECGRVAFSNWGQSDLVDRLGLGGQAACRRAYTSP